MSKQEFLELVCALQTFYPKDDLLPDKQSIRYNVSYQQVYTWVKKYRELGEAGLEDRRGQRTCAQEPRNELEQAKIEIAELKHKYD